MHCVNVIEDIRIERRMSSMFPGSPVNLRAAHSWLMDLVAKNWTNISPFMRACVAYGEYSAYGESDFWNAVVDDVTKDLVVACTEAVGDTYALNSTADCVQAGLRMWEVLKDLAEEEEKNSSKESSAKASDQGGATLDNSATGKSRKSSSVPISIDQLAKSLAADAKQLTSAKNKLAQNYKHGLSSDDTYLIYSTANDSIRKIPAGDAYLNSKRLQKLRSETRDITSVIRTRLVNSLRAKSRRRWVANKEEGKINSRHLYKAVLNLDEKVYKQLTDKVSLNTVVMLAIDHSKSMTGRPLELAGEAAIVIGDALNTLRVPFAVYGYSTSSPLETPPDSRSFARWSNLWIRYYRDFAEPWDSGAVKLAGARYNAQENTLDGESIKHGITKLLQRPEQRKILFVFNDGMPYPGHGDTGRCQQHLRNVLESAKAAGIEVVAFGVLDESVKEYYSNYVIIRQLQDLSLEPLKILDSMLRKGVRK
jgi:cobalamin biosynthesis protein CobT